MTIKGFTPLNRGVTFYDQGNGKHWGERMTSPHDGVYQG